MSGSSKCPYCKKTISVDEWTGNPDDYGLHPFVNWKDISMVCGHCDSLVVQTDRQLKRIIDSNYNNKEFDRLVNHIREFQKRIADEKGKSHGQ